MDQENPKNEILLPKLPDPISTAAINPPHTMITRSGRGTNESPRGRIEK
ncbi:MAG: hypothetical protein VX694_11680 [Planctomycetota bacterium]|nr:hypothetical protein [Planctomycetota bacterium]